MIVLTGDIHHSSLGTGNQRASDVPEVRLAARYLRLLEEADVKVTFFVSGRTFAEEWEDLAPISRHPLVELGGHNWSCFSPALPHRVWNRLAGSYNGPAWVQRRDAARTLRIAFRRTGRRLRWWRNHMYMHGPHTDRVLASLGIELCADGTVRQARGPTWDPAGLWTFPLNVIPDHEHLYHAERTPAWVARWQERYRWSDDWGPASYHIDEWVELVLADLERNEARGAVSHLIVHPITMYLCDGFRGFERILSYLASRETVHYGELLSARRAA